MKVTRLVHEFGRDQKHLFYLTASNRSGRWTWTGSSGASPRRFFHASPELLRREQLVDLRHHGKRVGDVNHVGLAARPAAVGVQADGPALFDEAPADRVRLFAVAAGGKPFGWRGVEPVLV